MGIVDFQSEGVEEAINVTGLQIQRVDEIIANLRDGVAPLQNGGWIGEGAQAFFEDYVQFIAYLTEVLQIIADFYQALQQAQQRFSEASDAVIKNIGA